MDALLHAALNNAAWAAALALAAAAGARIWRRRPALAHALWLLVLLKLVTPSVDALPAPRGCGHTAGGPRPGRLDRRGATLPRPGARIDRSPRSGRPRIACRGTPSPRGGAVPLGSARERGPRPRGHGPGGPLWPPDGWPARWRGGRAWGWRRCGSGGLSPRHARRRRMHPSGWRPWPDARACAASRRRGSCRPASRRCSGSRCSVGLGWCCRRNSGASSTSCSRMRSWRTNWRT